MTTNKTGTDVLELRPNASAMDLAGVNTDDHRDIVAKCFSLHRPDGTALKAVDSVRAGWPSKKIDSADIYVHDIFRPAVHDDVIHAMFTTMNQENRHKYWLLTRHPERVAQFLKARGLHETGSTHVVFGAYAYDAESVEKAIGILRGWKVPCRILVIEGPLGDLGTPPMKKLDGVVIKPLPFPESDNPGFTVHPPAGILAQLAKSISDSCKAAGVPFLDTTGLEAEPWWQHLPKLSPRRKERYPDLYA